MVYCSHAPNKQAIVKALVTFGLESYDQSVAKEVLFCLPLLLTKYLQPADLSVLVISLYSKLNDDVLNHPARVSLRRIRDLAGEERFTRYVNSLHPDAKVKVLSAVQDRPKSTTSHTSVESDTSMEAIAIGGSGRGWLDFGLVDSTLKEKLTNREDWRTKQQGVEEFHYIITQMDDVSPLLPHIRQFLVFLDYLLEDINFKVLICTFEIYDTMVDKLRSKIRPHLKHVVYSLMNHVGNTQVVVRMACYRVLTHVMQATSPKEVINVVRENLKHRSSRVREDALYVILLALVTFPSNDFNTKDLMKLTLPTLVDPKKRIRQGGLECLAVVAQYLGQSKLQDLIAAVNNVELHGDNTGLVSAVQERLRRRVLPRLNDEGLVEYGVYVPQVNGSKHYGMITQQFGADVAWIVAGSGPLSMLSARMGDRPDSRYDSLKTSPKAPKSFPSSPSLPKRSKTPSKALLSWPADRTSYKERSLSDGTIFSLQALDEKENEDFAASRSRSMWNIETYHDDNVQDVLILSKKDISRQTAEVRSGMLLKPLVRPDTAYENQMEIIPVPYKPSLARGNSALRRNRMIPLTAIPKREVSLEQLENERNGDDLRVEDLYNSSGSSSEGIIRHNLQRLSESVARMSTSTEQSKMHPNLGRDEIDQVLLDRFTMPKNKLCLEPIEIAEKERNIAERSLEAKLRAERQRRSKDESSSSSEEEEENEPESKETKPENVGNEYSDDFLSDSSESSSNKPVASSREAKKRNHQQTKEPKKDACRSTSSSVKDDRSERTESGNQKTKLNAPATTRVPRSRMDAKRYKMKTKPSKTGMAASSTYHSSDDIRAISRTRPGISRSHSQPPSTTGSFIFSGRMEPFAKPRQAFVEATDNMKSGEWEKEILGIKDIVAILVHHGEVLRPEIHSVCTILLKSVENLRSQVSRTAIQAFAELFKYEKKNMEPSLEKIATVLLAKTTDTNKFIREDSNRTLDALMENISESKSIPTISSIGLHHKNALARTTVARLLANFVETTGAAQLLEEQKQIANVVLTTGASLLQEGSLETRKHAKRIFQPLVIHPQFGRILAKTLPLTTIRAIQKILDGLKNTKKQPVTRIQRNRRT